MANTLGFYDPNFYAATALVQLEKALGMAGRVYRGYDKNPQEYGSVINLRRPTYFVAQQMPISSANTSNLTPDNISITLDQWHGVQFSLSDKELNYSQERIINEHIRPAASAVADKIDVSINQKATEVPWYFPVTGTTDVKDIPALRRRMFENQVPLNDIHLELNGEREQYFLGNDTFNKANESANGGETQMTGSLGRKFGFEIFANQNVQAQPAGGTLANATAAATANQATLSAALTAGTACVITIAAATLTGTLKVGDIIQVGVAGTNTGGLGGKALTTIRNFVVATDATAAANAISATCFGGVRDSETAASGAVVSWVVQSASKYDNLAFHRNFAALAMAPLPETAARLGAQIASVADPITGLALRVTLWYEGLDAKVYVRIDALWGVKVLDRDMAVRYVSA